MSKANEKTPTPQTDAPTGGTNLAVVQPAPSAPDAFHGRGGRYTVINGVLQRVQCTEATHTTQPAAHKAKE